MLPREKLLLMLNYMVLKTCSTIVLQLEQCTSVQGPLVLGPQVAITRQVYGISTYVELDGGGGGVGAGGSEG